MNQTRSFIAVGTMAAALGATAAARAESPIQQGKDNQQQRIAAGIASGRLTAGEAARREGKDAGLDHEVQAMRPAGRGRLSAGDRAVVNRQQNRLSRGIVRFEHNAPRRP